MRTTSLTKNQTVSINKFSVQNNYTFMVSLDTKVFCLPNGTQDVIATLQ